MRILEDTDQSLLNTFQLRISMCFDFELPTTTKPAIHEMPILPTIAKMLGQPTLGLRLVRKPSPLGVRIHFSIMGMPRKCKVPMEDAINVVKTFMQHFVTDDFPPYTSQVWRDMSAQLNGWTFQDVYTHIRKDRRNILTIAREELNIAVLDNTDKMSQPERIVENGFLNDSAINEWISSDSDDETWSTKANVKKKKRQHESTPTTEFELILTEKEWDSIKPDGIILYGNRMKEILQVGVWTNVISIAFWKQHKLNCAFVYKRANIVKDSIDNFYVVNVYGKCKSAACGNTFLGHGKKFPHKKGLIINVNTRDTRSETHENVKRPFSGQRRKDAAQEMVGEGCAIWKRRQARENMKEEDHEPAFLPDGDVMRQAKKERIHANLNVKAGDARDLIRTIENISVDPEYLDLIQAVGSTPFYVFYSTPAQLDAYKKYLRLNKARNEICLDATGSLVRKLDRPGNTKSGHIFLYSIVINFEKTTQPVYQMLSEKHETEFIEYWLKQWCRRGAPKPKKAVSDYSRALISALCLAFNNRTIKSYLNICFAIIENPSEIIERPATIIRIDVAHLIHMVCRWKCFRSANQACIKEFFVRCIALMVECETLESFRTIFTLTCAVGLQSHEDSKIEVPHVGTTKEARKKLETYIASRGIENKLNQHQSREEMDYTRGPFEFDVPDNTRTLDDDTKAGNRLENWVAEQKERAGKTVHKGIDPNAFYLPEFIERLYRLAKEFLLWTSVVMPPGSPHATSSYVEAYFNDIKKRVFSTIKPPVRVDLFIKNLARNIIGETLLFVSKLKKAEMRQSELERGDKREAELREIEVGQVKLRQVKTTKIDDSSRSEPYEDTDIVGAQPILKCTASGEPIFAEDVSFFVEVMSSIDDEKTFNDSDLMSAEDWRGKAPIHKDVDNFSLIETTLDHKLRVDITVPQIFEDSSSEESTIIDLRTDVHLDHSYSGSGNFQSPIKLADIPNNNRSDATKRSKYFREYPEVRQKNMLSANFKKPDLLPNGTLCSQGIQVDGHTMFIRNTCPFDSLIHVLTTSGIDDVQYASFLEKSRNSTLKFVSSFIKSGVTREILYERINILKEFYAKQIALQTKTRALSYSIDAYDSIQNLAKHTMSSEPSVFKTEECSQCNGRQYSFVSIAPNHNILVKRGFGALNSALAFKPIVYDLTCNKNCSGKFTLYTKPNFHILIDLDVRDLRNHSHGRSRTGLRCRLEEIPLTLDLEVRNKEKKEAKEKTTYRLTGLVAYSPGHFIAYCRRSTGSWQIYNDTCREMGTCASTVEIEPHLAVYIRETDNDKCQVHIYI